MSKVYTIGIGGPSCSGKTKEEDIPIDESTQLANWDCPESIDFEKFLRMIVETQKNGGRLPVGFKSKEALNLHDGSSQLTDTSYLESDKLNDYRFVIVDGFRLYEDRRIYNRLDFRLSLTASYQTLKERREAREGYHTTGCYWVDPPGYFDSIVWPEYQRLCQQEGSLLDLLTLDTDQHTIESMMSVVLQGILSQLE
ncbi:hypothetical protein BY458DRAFT_446342 [Sporodiniella umbellata]|nr:hypothetical protein BY458DRAFT_446342 [Sporodiniella umbellata]